MTQSIKVWYDRSQRVWMVTDDDFSALHSGVSRDEALMVAGQEASRAGLTLSQVQIDAHR